MGGAVSPDGRWLAYESYEGSNEPQVFVAHPDGRVFVEGGQREYERLRLIRDWQGLGGGER